MAWILVHLVASRTAARFDKLSQSGIGTDDRTRLGALTDLSSVPAPDVLMRVLLANTNTRADLLAAPPVGAACVATAAAAAGHEVRLLDLCFVRDRDRELTQAVSSFHPEVVGLSIRNLENVNLLRPISYVDDARHVIDIIRGLTNAPIVLGGSAVSLCPGPVLQELKADYVVAGDGETAFVALLSEIGATRVPRGIPGVGFLAGDAFQFSPPAFSDALFGNPHLARWVNLTQYRRMGSSYTIQTKRGCCQHCIYCTYNQALEGRSLRLRPPEDVVAEIEEAVLRHGITDFDFVDSVFNEPVDHCREILERICKCSWKARFTAMGMTPRRVDRAFLSLLWEAGFRSFMMTPDSASGSVLRRYGKGFGVEDLAGAATALDGTGFAVMWFFLVGGPGETHDTIEETLEFVRRHLARAKRPRHMMAHFYLGVRVYPGTQLWDVAIRDGFVAPESDPLQTQWYISPQLDIVRAVDQLVQESLIHPEVGLGFDERYLAMSGLAAALGRVFHLVKPYWCNTAGFNGLLIGTGLRRLLRPRDLGRQIQERLARQRAAARTAAR